MIGARMEAALNLQPQRTRGIGLLLHHCAGIGQVDERPSARTRLEQELGCELTELLVAALAPGCQGLRGSSSP
jgi:hypothetical protein